MSHYQPYPAYKNSGVEWIGQVPEHWARTSVKHVLSVPITDGPHETPVFLSEGVEFLSVDGIQDGELVFEGKRFISHEDHVRFCRKAKPQLDDVLVGKSASVGKVARVKTSADFNVWSPLAILRPSPKICEPAYLEFALKADVSQRQIMLAGNTSTQANVSMDRLGSVGIPLPPLCEQQRIVQVIVQESTRIDALIEKKTRFIDLLQEKRQALITHAVTKGLDPNVRMKDSGVEWIGQVPEHWELGRLDEVSNIVRGNSEFSKSDLLEHGQYVALQYGRTYKVDEINDSFSAYVNQEFFKPNQVAEIGDTVLISTSETLEDLGHSCFYNREDVGLIGGEQFLLKPNKEKTIGKYLYYSSKAFSRYLQKYATGLKVFRFGSDDLKTLYLPKLSQDEQEKIVHFLDRQTLRMDTLIEKTQQSITLLKERRAAFITAAVTGQIDLRGEQQ